SHSYLIGDRREAPCRSPTCRKRSTAPCHISHSLRPCFCPLVCPSIVRSNNALRATFARSINRRMQRYRPQRKRLDRRCGNTRRQRLHVSRPSSNRPASQGPDFASRLPPPQRGELEFL